MVFIQKPFFIILPLLISFLLQKKDQQQYTLHGYAQGTDYSIKYLAEGPLITQFEVDSILLQLDSSMSLYKPYSLICKFNSSTKGLVLDAQFTAVMKKSFEIYKQTGGKFDVTVGPLVQAWGFGVRPVDQFPDSLKIRDLLKVVGMNGLKLKGNYLKKNKPGIQIDLNGIAQGYSVDEVANFLLKKRITSFVVEIGGELRVKGPKLDGSPRKIGIEGPSLTPGAEPEIRNIISFAEGAITTSGNYRKYLKRGTGKIAHLIDPKTGYPLDNQMISVTIFAKDAITADGFDNAVMAMDVNEALAFVNAKKDMEAYMIYHRKDGSITDTMTVGFKKMIVN